MESTEGTSHAISTEELEQHLRQCASCSSAMEKFWEGDPLMKLASESGWPPMPIDVETQKLNRRIIDTLKSRLGDAIETINPSPAQLDEAMDLDWLEKSEFTEDLGKLGDFRILKLLGHGGMGAVFEAEDQRLQRRVAIKVILPRRANDAAVCERFLREARAAASVHHRNVVTIFEVGQSGNVPYLAMELLHGESLEDRIKRIGAMPIPEILRIGVQMSEGLAMAHSKGLIHRDIKPANVWLEGIESRHRDERLLEDQRASESTQRTNSSLDYSCDLESKLECVKLLDFGLARSFTESSELTESGLILGTPAYMAPEQVNGKTDARTDLFGLGIVLYRMATGCLPFPGRTTLEILNSLANVTPVAPSEHRPDLPKSLCELIKQLLSKSPSSRPESADMVARRLFEIERTYDRDVDTRTAKEEISGGSRIGKTRSLVLFAGFGLLALLSVVVLKIKTKDGKETEVILNVPGDVDSATVTLGDSKEPSPSAKVIGSEEKSDRTTSAPPAEKSNVIVKPAAFDRNAIPAAERFDWQPDDLVAVIGNHHLRHWNAVEQIRFHPSGEFFVTVPARGDPMVWHADTLESFGQTMQLGRELFGRVEFSGDGKSIGCANQLFAVDTSIAREPKFNFVKQSTRGDNKFGTAGIGIYENRWFVIPADSKDGFMIWDTHSNSKDAEKQVTCEELDPYNQLLLSQDGKRLITFGNGVVQVIDVDWQGQGEPTFTIRGEKIPATRAAISPNGSTLVTTLEGENKLRIWDVDQTPFSLTKEINQGGLALEFSSDSKTLHVGVFGQVDIYRHANDTWYYHQKALSDNALGAVTALAVSPDTNTLVAGCLDGGIHLWDLPQGKTKSQFPNLPASNIRSLTFSPNGLSMLVQGSDNQATLWSLNTTSPSRVKWETYCDPSQLPSFSQGSNLVRVYDGIWDLEADLPLKISESVNVQARFANDGDALVSLDNLTLRQNTWTLTQRGRFQIADERKLCVFEPSVHVSDVIETLQFKPQRFATRLDDKRVAVWSMSSLERPLFELKHNLEFGNSGRPLTLSADGKVLLVYSQTGSKVWDLEESPPYEYALDLNGSVNSTCFSLDSRLLFVGDANGVAIYDWVHNREVRRIQLPGPVRQLVLHPDGTHLATVNGNGTVYILRLPELLK